jgi:hypothetical protein
MIFLDVGAHGFGVVTKLCCFLNILLFGCECPICTSSVRVNAEKLVKTLTEGVADEVSRSLSIRLSLTL